MKSSKAIKLPEFINKPTWRFRIPHVDVRSVEDYFNLPIKEREWHGLYKLPYALPSELFGESPGWETFYNKIKSLYPFQYFFRDWLFSWENPVILCFYKQIVWPLTDLKRNLKCIIKPYYPRWRKLLLNHVNFDVTELVIESNFALIRDFYWEEVVDGHVVWEDTEDHKQFYDELVSAVEWIEKERKILDSQVGEAYQKASGNRLKTNERFDYYATYEEPMRLEKLKQDREEEILKWFISNRQYFWT
jgi:hypothetical protein